MVKAQYMFLLIMLDRGVKKNKINWKERRKSKILSLRLLINSLLSE